MSEASEDRDERAGGATMLQPVILRLTLPQCRRFRRSQTNFALQAVVQGRAAVAKWIAALLRWHADGGEVRRGLPGWACKKQKTEKLAVLRLCVR